MSYAGYLKDLLAPLGVYDLEGTINGASLETKGAALDALADVLEETARESDLTTAQSWGLENWRGLFELLPAASDPKAMRESIWALLRIGAGSSTLAAIRDTLRGCGLPVQVRELGAGRVEVSFPDVTGVPDNFEAIRHNVEQILPAHVEIEYMMRYLTWAALEAHGWTFGDISAMTWDELQYSE